MGDYGSAEILWKDLLVNPGRGGSFDGQGMYSKTRVFGALTGLKTYVKMVETCSGNSEPSP